MVYRILSLDRGGTWSLIQVKALMALYGESTSGHTVLKDFDLVAGNSGAGPEHRHHWCSLLPVRAFLQM